MRMEDVYARRRRHDWRTVLYRAALPPAPFIQNPEEPLDFPLGHLNLYIGGAGARPDGYINLDLFAMPGVDVAADAEQLPFRDCVFQRVECDAVLEHVKNPDQAVRELSRVLAPGGYMHVVTPFCHPFHAYPSDFRRFTIDGLRQLAGNDLDVVAQGWRTGPTATLLVFILEYVKLLLPWKLWRALAHGVLGWALFPFRYLDLWLLRSQRAGIIGNHCYVWLRKRPVV
jgi:SAM-dependent methyltransferase